MLSVRKPRPFPTTLPEGVGELEAHVSELERKLRLRADQEEARLRELERMVRSLTDEVKRPGARKRHPRKPPDPRQEDLNLGG